METARVKRGNQVAFQKRENFMKEVDLQFKSIAN